LNMFILLQVLLSILHKNEPTWYTTIQIQVHDIIAKETMEI